ncbi:hypothetical protein HMPREF1986_00429 [Oribacterium sp. oral taxon 078 str. F0263]|nr:hypothetical protein HMPREF1986_00429 [Oribacterium sp. oral taxon 078 str. F0263]
MQKRESFHFALLSRMAGTKNARAGKAACAGIGISLCFFRGIDSSPAGTGGSAGRPMPRRPAIRPFAVSGEPSIYGQILTFC